jgi:hypothetical protein
MKWGGDKLDKEFFPEEKYRKYYHHKCDRCGKVKEVRNIEDPWELEENDIKIKKYLCDECYDFLIDKI